MKIFHFITAVVVTGFLMSEVHAGSTNILPADNQMKCTLEQEDFNNNWAKINFAKKSLLSILSNGALSEIGPVYDKSSGMVYVFPANGPKFTDQLGGSYANQPSNCSFFKWSSQMFLWLTSPVTDELCTGACKLPNKSPANNTNYVFSSEFFYRLSDNKTKLVAQGAGSTSLKIRSTKTDTSHDSVGQAGSDGVLFLTPADDAISNGTEPLVYYSVHTNRPFGYVRAAEQQVNTKDMFSEFPADHKSTCQALIYGLSNGYAQATGKQGQTNAILLLNFCADVIIEDTLKQVVAKFETTEIGPVLTGLLNKEPQARAQASRIMKANGLTIPSLEMAIDYLSMAMEVKASWVPSWVLADKSGYILHKANLPTYTKNTDGSLAVNGNKETEVALVGMHVVGSVKGHPEMIWSTFEHYKNAPNTTYAYVAKNGETKYHSDRFISDSHKWLFNNGSMAGINKEFARTNKSMNILKVSKSNPVTTASNVVRLSPWGSLANNASADINSQMISTNQQVIAAFNSFYAQQGIKKSKDPRSNYILTGSSWGTDGKFPTYTDKPLTKNISGSPAMENATLETFTQSFGTSMNTSGCFSCHAVSKSSETTNGDFKFDVSHIFDSITTVEKNKN